MFRKSKRSDNWKSRIGRRLLKELFSFAVFALLMVLFLEITLKYFHYLSLPNQLLISFVSSCGLTNLFSEIVLINNDYVAIEKFELNEKENIYENDR